MRGGKTKKDDSHGRQLARLVAACVCTMQARRMAGGGEEGGFFGKVSESCAAREAPR